MQALFSILHDFTCRITSACSMSEVLAGSSLLAADVYTSWSECRMRVACGSISQPVTLCTGYQLPPYLLTALLMYLFCAGYLGEDKKAWREYDAVCLIQDYSSATPPPPMMVDTGSADPFVTSQLRPDALEAAAKEKGFSLQSRLCDGYDHSYYFISTFVEEHINFHAKALGV